jgi:hypothetical protein
MACGGPEDDQQEEQEEDDEGQENEEGDEEDENGDVATTSGKVEIDEDLFKLEELAEIQDELENLDI